MNESKKYGPFRVPFSVSPRAAEQMQMLSDLLKRQEKERSEKAKEQAR